MPREDVSIGQDTDTRSGYNSAVDRFCDAADGETLGSGDTYLSYATETELNFGKAPAEYGQFGFVYCESGVLLVQGSVDAGAAGLTGSDIVEIHNRQDIDHSVNGKFPNILGTMPPRG